FARGRPVPARATRTAPALDRLGQSANPLPDQSLPCRRSVLAPPQHTGNPPGGRRRGHQRFPGTPGRGFVEARSRVSTAVSLSRFEANLVRILRFFVRAAPASQAEPILFARCPRPPCLTRACVRLVQDTLARGCVRLLARGDG